MPDSPAIRHALLRLEKARAAQQRLTAASTLDQAESAWTDLLIAGNGVYSKLEQGSKCNGKAAAWFGRAKKARKDDQLLSYMHHARNSEEHGIEDITKRMERGQSTVTVREPMTLKPGDTVGFNVRLDAFGRVKIDAHNPKDLIVKNYDTPDIALVTVKDPRFSDVFHPPCFHKDNKLDDQSPAKIGELFIEYLELLINNARLAGV